jgi:hypothetical protein
MGRTNIGSLFDAKELISHIKIFKMMKTCQMSIKQNTQQRGGKKYKMEGPKSWQKENISKRVDPLGNRNKSST